MASLRKNVYAIHSGIVKFGQTGYADVKFTGGKQENISLPW